MIKQIALNAILLIAMIFIATQVGNVQQTLEKKRPYEISPVSYSELSPEKDEYAAGDLVSFAFDRTCRVNDKDLPLLMLTVDSFENLDTGEIFGGTFASRIVRRNGTEHFRALRRLSPDATPGTYSFEGWVNIQGPLPVQAVPYSSRKFKVKANP